MLYNAHMLSKLIELFMKTLYVLVERLEQDCQGPLREQYLQALKDWNAENGFICSFNRKYKFIKKKFKKKSMKSTGYSTYDVMGDVGEPIRFYSRNTPVFRHKKTGKYYIRYYDEFN